MPSGGGETTRSITVHQYSDDVSMYDGSSHVASFSADNTINDIALDGKTIKIPKGVILGNMNGSDSIDLEKNISTNTVKISVKDAYINNLADIRTSIAITPINERIDTLSESLNDKSAQLDSSIKATELRLSSDISTLSSSLDSKSSVLNRRIDNLVEESNTTTTSIFEKLGTIFEDIDNISERINNFETDQNAKHSALGTTQDEILERLLAIDADNSTSLKGQVATLSNSLDGLSTSLSSILADITKIKQKINSIHGQGTI